MKKRREFFIIGAVFALVVTLASGASAQRVSGKFHRAQKSVPGEYIVVLKESAVLPSGLSLIVDLKVKNGRKKQAVSSAADTLRQKHGGSVRRKFGAALPGFSANLTEAQALQLSQDPRVEFVEENSIARAVDFIASPPWGLDRIDQRHLPLSGSYYNGLTSGAVHVYVIDTGIDASHSQLIGRVGSGAGFVPPGYDTDDDHGHGTHVAGTIGGYSVGVANGAIVHPVKVLDFAGNGTIEQVIEGIEWVTTESSGVGIVNMSLQCGDSVATDNAVRSSISSGLTYVIAAGNFSNDAGLLSPARVTEAITVGATDSSDSRAWFSNYGSVVDLFAPGVNINSAAAGGGYVSMSGTSMAAPHVAGLAAIYLEEHPGSSPATVQAAIIANATPSKVISAGPSTTTLLANLGWKKLPDTARDLDVGGNGLGWMIGTTIDGAGNYGIYRWNNGSWFQVDGGAVRIAAGPDGKPWVVNSWGGIYRRENDTIGWITLPGGGTDIDVGADGSVWLIGTDVDEWGNGGIYRWVEDSYWEKVDGGATRVAVAGDGRPWVVNSSGDIWRREDDYIGWQWIPGSAVDLASGADGSIWKIDSTQSISKWNGSTWESFDRSGVGIAVGPNGNSHWLLKASQAIELID